MGKVSAPRDLLNLQSNLEQRVTWLETHFSGNPPESAVLVAHVHDIVEHLFRGSMQAGTGAAPFGHLAAHYWESEHDDPAIEGDWEFHRLMRVLRERIGANLPLVDMIGSGPSLAIDGGRQNRVRSEGWHRHDVSSKGGSHRVEIHGQVTEDYCGGKPAHYAFVAGGTYGSQIFQPLMLPGAPQQQVTPFGGFSEGCFTVYYYNRSTGQEFNPEGAVVKEFGEVGHEEDYISNSEYAEDIKAPTPGPGNTIVGAEPSTVTEQYASDEGIARTDPGASNHAPRGMRAYSSRWVGTTPLAGSVTYPPASESEGEALHNGEGEGPKDTDYFALGIEEPVSVFYDEGPKAFLSGTAGKTQTKLYTHDANYKVTDKTGAYNSKWYLAMYGSGYQLKTEHLGSVSCYIPADYIQSDKAPEDYDGTQALPTPRSGEYEPAIDLDPPSPEGNTLNGSGSSSTRETTIPLRTFEEAVPLFEEEIKDPKYAALVAFWERHLTSFNARGSAFNHGWEQRGGTGKLKKHSDISFLTRYGYVHLRGKGVLDNLYAAGLEHSMCLLPEGAPEPIDRIELNVTLHTNIGPVQGLWKPSLVVKQYELFLPHVADVGPGSSSGLTFFDLDGITYPYV